jgi:hypothetical protein
VTRSKILISRVRNLVHEEISNGNSSPLLVAALDLASEHELAIDCTLRLEECIHDMVKATEKGKKC